MKDPILLNKLWKEVEAGNVAASSSGSLTIFKYTQACHIEGRWNEVNRQARGIIFQTDGTVVARPFEKFFNLDELPESSSRNLPWKEGVEVYEKVDGSCGIGYVIQEHTDGVGWVSNWRLATPGSMESDQAVEGTAILNEWAHNSPAHALAATGEATVRKRYKLEHLPLDCTPVFEIIYPENRIVVDYKGQRELVLLAIFEHNGVEWHPRRVDQIAQACGFRRPKRYDIDLQGEIPFEDNHEGYVARFGNGFRVKIKSPVYLRIHRILNHLSPKGVVELMRGKEYGPTVAQLPKEIAKDFDDVRAHVQGLYNTLFFAAHDRRDILLSELGENSSRKEKAAWIQDNVPNAECGFVFALLDGKDIEDKVWKLVLEKVKDEAGPRPAEVA